MIPRPKVQFVEVPSTSGPKTIPDVNVQTIGWEMAPIIAKEQPGSEIRTTDLTPTSTLCCLPDEESGLEGWPSDSEWMVNHITTRSKKRGESPSKKPSSSRGRRKESRPKKAGKIIDSSTSDSPPETKPEERNIYKDDISDLIQKALQDQTLMDTPTVASAPTNKESPPAEARPPIVIPTREELQVNALSRLVIIATMDYDLVESLVNTPA
ncbi:hypothetical protein R1flu_024393 [Riccia fluitans]|uniref:Uncharacterized protein n=1 Tax=Riccia fluitans TaxID=41844 RepID=A0ABD1XXS7_9MARC